MLVPDILWSIGTHRTTDRLAAPNTMSRVQTDLRSIRNSDEAQNKAEMPAPSVLTVRGQRREASSTAAARSNSTASDIDASPSIVITLDRDRRWFGKP